MGKDWIKLQLEHLDNMGGLGGPATLPCASLKLQLDPSAPLRVSLIQPNP